MLLDRRIFYVATAVLLTAGSATSAPAQFRPDDGIVVIGTGRVSVAPDTAVLTLGVESQAATLADATADAARRMSAVLARVKGLGVADADIVTVSYTVDPRAAPPDPARRDDPPRIVGYRVTNVAQVTVKKLPDAASILDAAVAAGANAVRGIRFTLADPAKAQAQARASAVAEALARVRELAAAAGVKPGDVLTIREMGGPQPVPVMRMSAAAASPATPVEPGQLDVVVIVELRQAIQR